MPTPHIHAEVIHAFADGAKVQVRLNGAEHWQETKFPDFCDECEYRIKPEPAAPKWPQTTMTEEELAGKVSYIIQPAPGQHPGPFYASVANAALARACETGQVVPADKVREISAGAYAQGAKSARDPVDIIEAVFDHLRAGIADPESIQAILLRAAK